MTTKKPNFGWFSVFLVLFSSITGGVFLWAIGADYNIYWASGCALVVGGALFTILFTIYLAEINVES